MSKEHGFTSWELEAARRREVAAIDHGAHARPGDDRLPQARHGQAGGIHVPSWLATLGRGAARPSRAAVTTLPECQPHVRAVRPGA